MFSNFFLKSFRILLFPFALLFWFGIAVRNWMYNKGIWRSTSFGLPMICVGNLSVGGTGKSPMVEYLIELLKDQFKIATLSRGYKRRTSGYALASPGSTALDIGDEPMQFHLKYPSIAVAVGEKRLEAIPQLLHDHPETQVIILDDAFQHRAIRAGLNILLTDHTNLFIRDFYLPTGDLRDQKISYKRADMLIVTKCNKDLNQQEKEKLLKDLDPLAHQQVFFTAIEYGDLYHITTRSNYWVDAATEVLLVIGIANPQPLQKMLEEQCQSYHMMQFNDHHIFTIDDLKEIQKKLDQMDAAKKIIITTEKDAVRLLKFDKEISALPIYVMPVRHRFLFNEGARFENSIRSFILDFKKAS